MVHAAAATSSPPLVPLEHLINHRSLHAISFADFCADPNGYDLLGLSEQPHKAFVFTTAELRRQLDDRRQRALQLLEQYASSTAVSDGFAGATAAVDRESLLDDGDVGDDMIEDDDDLVDALSSPMVQPNDDDLVDALSSPMVQPIDVGIAQQHLQGQGTGSRAQPQSRHKDLVPLMLCELRTCIDSRETADRLAREDDSGVVYEEASRGVLLRPNWGTHLDVLEFDVTDIRQ